MMRPLILGPAELASIEEVLTFAARPENHYRPFAGDTVPPGDKEGYVRNFGLPDRPYRCVYSLSVASNGELFRHLSISIPRMQEQATAPHPIALWTLARAYGFTGWDGVSVHPPSDWVLSLPGFCVAIVQAYIPAEGATRVSGKEIQEFHHGKWSAAMVFESEEKAREQYAVIAEDMRSGRCEV